MNIRSILQPTWLLTATMSVALMITGSSYANPTVSVTGVTATPNLVCGPQTNSTTPSSVSISATVSATYDTSSDTTQQGKCDTVKSGRTITGYTRTDTETIITYTPGTLNVMATDGVNSASLTAGPPYTGSLPVGPEGKTSVTVQGSTSETKTTQVNTIVNTWPASAGGCTGTASTVTTLGTPSSTPPLPGSGSGVTSYRTDLVGPTISLKPPHGHDVPQGASFVEGFNAIGGSAGASYVASFSATGTGSLGPLTLSGAFPTSDNPNGSGIATNHHIGPAALSTTCTTPVGAYTLTAKLDSNNLCSGVNTVTDPADYTVSAQDTFTVIPGLSLESQTVVVSELPGGYDVDQCFTAQSAAKKINTNPGSVHIAEIVTSAGNCQGTDNLNAWCESTV